MTPTRRAFLQGCMGSIALLTSGALPRRTPGSKLYTAARQSRAARIFLVLYDDQGREVGGKERIWFGKASGGQASNLNEVNFTVVNTGKLDRVALLDKHGEPVPVKLPAELSLTSNFACMGDEVIFAPGTVVVTL